jgi:hypothetical protein
MTDTKTKSDFTVYDHGTLWTVIANYESSVVELGGQDHIIGDWRPTWHFCQELHAQGFTFECSSPTAQKLIDEGRPW